MSLSLLSQDRLIMLEQLVEYASRNLLGAFVECGVYRGGSALAIAGAMGKTRTLWAYDRFGPGLPRPGRHDLYRGGEFGGNDFDTVQQMMPDNVRLIQGFFKDTLPEAPGAIAFAHIDADLYESTKECLDHLFMRMVPGGIMLFDDYNGGFEPGVKRAVMEFFDNRPQLVLPLITEQAVVFK